MASVKETQSDPSQSQKLNKKDIYKGLEMGTDFVPELKVKFRNKWTIISAGLIILLLFFGIGGSWVYFTEIEGAVIAAGELRVDTERKTVQHLEGGIVQDIFVRNGDFVKVGQPLIKLDSSSIVSAVDQLRLQITGVKIQLARFEAEKTYVERVEWPEKGVGVNEKQYQELIESSQKVFNAGREALVNNIKLLKKQIDQLKEQDKGLVGQIEASDKVVTILKEELDTKLVLFEDQFIDKLTILALQRSIAEKNGSRAELHGSRAQLGEKIAEQQLQISTLKNEYLQLAINQQADMQKQLFDMEQRLNPLLDAKRRLTIVAPVGGEVVALQVHSIGGVISPGQPLLDIVPKNSRLVVESSIQVKDITHISMGQVADVQLLAFNMRTTPKVRGKVIYISADRILQPSPYGDRPSYIVHVELNKEDLSKNSLEVTAGMPASVFIRTEPRTVFDYLIEPVVVNFDRALREN